MPSEIPVESEHDLATTDTLTVGVPIASERLTRSVELSATATLPPLAVHLPSVSMQTCAVLHNLLMSSSSSHLPPRSTRPGAHVTLPSSVLNSRHFLSLKAKIRSWRGNSGESVKLVAYCTAELEVDRIMCFESVSVDHWRRKTSTLTSSEKKEPSFPSTVNATTRLELSAPPASL